MEDENKGNTFKRIIQIFLLSLLIFTGLIFLIFPPIWAHNNGVKNLNNQLVKRQSNGSGSTQLGENGNITLSYTNDVFTFYNNNQAYNLNKSVYTNLISGNSITGSNDVFGLNCTNYFCFVYNPEYHNALAEDFDKIYDFVYYIELDNFNSITFRLGYYEIWTNDTDAFWHLTPIEDIDFNRVGIIPSYSVLNVSYYNEHNIRVLDDFINENGFNILIINYDYQVSNNIFTSYNSNRMKFVNLDKDFYTSLIDSAFDRGRDVGFDEGVNSGSMGSIFDVLHKAVNSISSILSIEVLPNISLWLLLSIPLAISIMVIIFKLLRGQS